MPVTCHLRKDVIMNDLVLSDSFADYFVILLMSRWRTISLSKYFSIDASSISKYSLTATPLVETCKTKEMFFEQILLFKKHL